jgi:dTDP-4-amino-4,6-dideoxygalactose transaminase
MQPSIEQAATSSLMLLLKEPVADTVIARGAEMGIAFHRTYLPPLYCHPYFANMSTIDVNGVTHVPLRDNSRIATYMHNCERLRTSLIGVPFHPFMDETDVADVVDVLQAII